MLKKNPMFSFIINLGLLLFGSAMVFSGLEIQHSYHMGHRGEIDTAHLVLGLNYFNWSDIHKISIVLLSIGMIFHIILHWEWYKAVAGKKKLVFKNQQAIILTIIFIFVAVTGYIPWLIKLSGGSGLSRRAFIEIHDKVTFVLLVYLIFHVTKRFKWFFSADLFRPWKPGGNRFMEQQELYGGSYHWWPPSGDHVILYKLNPVRFEHFDHFLDGWDGIKVLDVGCGGGYACEFLAQRRARVFGTDIMAESLQQAREHAGKNHLAIEYHQCTAERLPFNDRTMDVVTCFDVLEHIPDKVHTLGEIYRVLKPGGWLFFDTFNKTFWSKLFIIWLGEILIRFIPRGTHDWPLFISPADLRVCLEDLGFTQVALAGVKFNRHSRAKGDFPVFITSKGSTAVIYFGAARKPTSL